MRTERELRLPADADGARDAALAVRELLAAVDPNVAGACELAVMEACANVAQHAYGHGCGTLRVVLRLSRVRFSAAICDSGLLFDPSGGETAMPGQISEDGRGLPLIELCMDRLQWRRVEDENRLLMARSLREAA